MPDGLTFVDTNVLVYAHEREAGVRHDEAVSIVEGLWDHGTGCLSTQVLQEFYVTVTRKLARTISREGARRVVINYATWRVHQRTFGELAVANPFTGGR